MTKFDEVNKDIAMEVQVSEGVNTRHTIHDFYISKMALAIKRAVLDRTELQASIINMETALDTIEHIESVESQFLITRGTDIHYDSNELMGSVDTDIKLALIDIGRHFKASDDRYEHLLTDIVKMEEFKASADMVNVLACKMNQEETEHFMEEEDDESDEIHEITKEEEAQTWDELERYFGI